MCRGARRRYADLSERTVALASQGMNQVTRTNVESMADHQPDLSETSQLPANDSCCAHRQGLPIAEIAVTILQNRHTNAADHAEFGAVILRTS